MSRVPTQSRGQLDPPTPPQARELLRQLVRCSDGLGWRERVRSIDYFRAAEYPLTAHLLAVGAGDTILDWGGGDSPFGLWLASATGARVITVDPDWQRQAWQMRNAASGEACLRPLLARGQELPLASGSIRAVSCVSALEHVPGSGDSECLREMARVLQPSGRIVLTLPYGQRFEERPSTPAVPYFERRYDEDALRTRLLERTSLRELGRWYLVERPLVGTLRWSQLWYRLPFVLRLPWRRLVPGFAGRLLTWTESDRARAAAICLVLERPA